MPKSSRRSTRAKKLVRRYTRLQRRYERREHRHISKLKRLFHRLGSPSTGQLSLSSLSSISSISSISSLSSLSDIIEDEAITTNIPVLVSQGDRDPVSRYSGDANEECSGDRWVRLRRWVRQNIAETYASNGNNATHQSNVPTLSHESESAPEVIENDDDSGSQSEDEEQEISTDGKKRKLSEAQEGSTDEDEIATNLNVLSHADQKKREEQHDDNVLLPSSQGQKKKHSGSGDISDTNSKRQNSVWVGNLAFQTTVEDLKSFFTGAGEITRVNMPMKAAPEPARKPENRGIAYVDFSTPEGKSAAIALSEQPLTGRKLVIKDGDDFTGRPKPAESGESGVATPRKTPTAQKILKSQKQPPGPTLFLGNLGFKTTEANITEMLDAHHHFGKKRTSDRGAESKSGKSAQSKGWIRKVRMGTFEDSGLCKGFAFVDFVSTENATSALVNPKNYLLNGRKLVIEYASPDAVRRGMSKPKQQHQQRQVNKDDDNDDTSGERRGPRAIQHDNVGQDTEEHHRPSKRQRIEKAETTSA
ncbi:hypothetical protein JOM56_008879 [Amanita muscaria]